MKVLLFTVFALFLVYNIHANDIWTSVPGATSAEKIQNICNGVTLARRWLAGQPCTHPYFQNPSPTDLLTNENWCGMICSFWGGPAGTPSCTYWYQNTRVNSSVVIGYSPIANSMIGIHKVPGQYSFNQNQYNLVRDALTQAIQVVGAGSGAFLTAARNDFDTFLQANIVDSAAPACPVPVRNISWANPTTVGTVNVNPGDMVQWTWTDTAQHSVQSLSSGITFPGFGGETDSYAVGTNCVAAGNPCNLLNTQGVYAYTFTVPGQTVNFQCGIHTTAMTGTIQVSGGSTTTTTTGTVGDGTGVTGSSFSSSDASSVASWLSYFF